MDLPELLRRLRELEHENVHLRDAISRAYCGEPLDLTSTCQLPRGHATLHAWMSHDGMVIRW